MKSDIFILKRILGYCENIIDDMKRTGVTDEISFMEDTMLQRSCAFCISQIGEDVKKLSPKIKEENPQVDWRGIAGLRDIIVHAYGNVRQRSIWKTVSEEVPVLKDECIRIISRIEE